MRPLSLQSFGRYFKRREVWFFYLLPLILTLWVFWFVFWPRFEAIRNEKEVISRRKQTILVYERKVKKLKKELAKPEPALQEAAKKVFSGKEPYQIVAELQKKFEKIPEVSLRSFKVIKRKEERKGLERIWLSFVIYTDVKGLAEILSILESEPRALRVKMLSARYIKDRQGERLTVNLELEALFWKEKAS